MHVLAWTRQGAFQRRGLELPGKAGGRLLGSFSVWFCVLRAAWESFRRSPIARRNSEPQISVDRAAPGGPVPAAGMVAEATSLAWLAAWRRTGKETEDNEECMVGFGGGCPRGGSQRVRASGDVRRAGGRGLHGGKLHGGPRDLRALRRRTAWRRLPWRIPRTLPGGQLSWRGGRGSARRDAVSLLYDTGPARFSRQGAPADRPVSR